MALEKLEYIYLTGQSSLDNTLWHR